jgi:hypothetical protein
MLIFQRIIAYGPSDMREVDYYLTKRNFELSIVSAKFF